MFSARIGERDVKIRFRRAEAMLDRHAQEPELAAAERSAADNFERGIRGRLR